jgi:hypothetical protein
MDLAFRFEGIQKYAKQFQEDFSVCFGMSRRKSPSLSFWYLYKKFTVQKV